MNQAWENGKKTNLGLDFDPFGLNLSPLIFYCRFYLCKEIDMVPSYHTMQIKGKLMNQSWENGEKPNFRPNFGANLAPQIFFVGFTSTRC